MSKYLNIFLSHSDKDMWYVPRVEEAASFVGANVTHSTKGEGLSDRVMKGIEEAHFVLCISTCYTMNLPEVQRELCYAKGQGKFILPIAVGGCEPTGCMEGMRMLNFDESSTDGLVEGITELFLGNDGWDTETTFKAVFATGAIVSALEQIFVESCINDQQ
jgi:hypothetical protein